MQSIRRLGALIAEYPPSVWLLGFGTFLNVLGLSFIWPIITLYIHQHLGKPMTVAGLVMMLSAGGGALGSLLGGTLFDRVGARPVLVIGSLCCAVLIALPALSASWPVFVAVMFLYGISAAMPAPAISALVTKAWPEGGRRSFNFLYVAHNVGVAAGTAVGGLLAERSFTSAFVGGAVMALLVALFAFLTIHDRRDSWTPSGREVAAGSEANRQPDETPAIPWEPVIALFVGLLMLWVIYIQWLGAIPVTMQRHGISLASYSFLWTLNGLIIVLGQPLVAFLLKAIRSLVGQMLAGVGLFALSFALLLMPPVYPVFTLAMVVLTLGEMLLWPAVPAAVAEISPPARRGFLQGFIASAATAGRMVGPLLGGLIFDRLGYVPLIIIMTALYVIPVVAFGAYRRAARRLRPA